ncbi:SDR family NAD(P)-dependent oxidoreductase [Granulicella sp. 5B5]|uniref:oxidoreductase n=1 Tax=Granulicella sp. 5B5 TaxID=1617967 RepID=UPI0015F4E1BB|nr:oxidoreductase [Granulicella sp. 5B5]QMV19033.1 SDR family NAD(P)-dependent oxidoreductase [Granulicella sp. 5B5]
MATPLSTSQAGKVWFITGASVGFGRDLAELLLSQGARVVATARRIELLDPLVKQYPETALALGLDVTKPEQVDAAVAAATQRFGNIDVLVNNAGYGMVGAIEESDEREFRPMFETNVFGLIRLTQAVLPQMRARKAGTIVNLSSIGGLVGTPGFGMYNATKFAVEGLSEALAQEVKPLGIHVIIVEPGPFRTDFLARGEMPAAKHIADYDQTAGKMREYAEKQNGIQPGDPKKAVAAIAQAVESPNPPLRLLLGAVTIPRLQAKVDALLKDVSDWKDTTTGADFPAGT